VGPFNIAGYSFGEDIGNVGAGEDLAITIGRFRIETLKNASPGKQAHDLAASPSATQLEKRSTGLLRKLV